MMKRKWICILMVVVMMLSFASCGGAYGWEDDTTPDAPSTKTSESKDPNSNNPTVDVTDENLEKKECDIRVLSSDIWSWERRLSGIVAVIRSKDALGSLLLEDLSDVQLGTFELYCDDYEAEFFTESTLVLYAASSSSCCLPWIPKAEMVYDEEGNDWLRLHVDNVSNHYVHNEDDRQLLYLVEVSTTEIDAVDDVEIIFGDYEVPEKPDMPVINQKGEPIAFQNIETLADYIYEYNYKQYEEQFRRSYQSMMKTIRKAGYLYSVDVQNAEIVDDGITIFPGGLDYGYDLGYAYLIEKDDVLYQVMICRIAEYLPFDMEDLIYEYCINRFGYYGTDCKEVEIQNEAFSGDYVKFYRYSPYKTDDVFYRSLIDDQYYIDIRTTTNTDAEGIVDLIESLTIEKVELNG